MRPLDNPPEARSRTRRGSVALIVEWRICTCGAFCKTHRLQRYAEQPKA